MNENEVYTENVNGDKFTVESYKEFMYDKKNIMKCEHCPMNEGFTEGPDANRLPCGQYHCWVRIHTRQ